MALPPFRDDGWLPEGHHETTWEEVITTFGGEPGSRRREVLTRLLQWRNATRTKGMSGSVILDGSFISEKAEPGDFDLIFVYDEATEQIVAQDADARMLLGGARCKERFGGDVFSFWITNVRNNPTFCRTDGFDLEKVTQEPKGVVEVRL